ncbi:DUF58 domain-containing protein [Halococcus saccharolyticus]|uniref:DUF58 domain-containing protein n=1 Tax=Halococcus saccharolyticus DSM 5350 TaxID=1227455 RepID=M0MHP8_9EURY|nr:DUF58 domain-containing protein [Halococcus saccharolyticus]EMA44229.1 hypothetical protein C449_11903 [Halococcus saccharolyticus DSM 5350]
MRPTRRAIVLAFVCVLAVWLAATFGARSLNAVVVPGVVALAAGAIQLRLADRPTIDRRQPTAGFPGESRTIRVDIDADDALTARIEEVVDDGLRTDFSPAKRALPATLEYDIELAERGEYRLGPLTLTVTDVLGLFTKTFTYAKRTPLLIYPECYRLTGVDSAFGGHDPFDDREAFDELREYVPGDSLRDVHWKSSAKRDDLVVMEFDSAADASEVTVAVEAVAGYDDAMATAAASIVTHLLDAGFAVELVYPGGRIEQAGGDPQRERVLRTLARAGPGRVESTDAAIHVLADAGGTHVTVADRETPFDRLTGARPTPAAADGGRRS